MVEDHSHDESGHVVAGASEPVAEIVAAEALAEASVAVAEIEASKEVTIARIEAKADVEHDLSEVELLRAEVAVLSALITPPEPEPEAEPEAEAEPAPQAPIVIEDEPHGEDTDPPEAEHSDPPEHHKKRVGLGVW